MKVLFAASECVPFIKTGGLADVVGALSPVLKAKGHDVRVILPLYSAIPEKWTKDMKTECEFEVELGWRKQYCGIKSLVYQGVTFYFVDNQFYFGRSYMDSPDVDGKVFFAPGSRRPKYGEFVKVQIDDAMDCDLMGTMLD